jgi:hypothetical protein
VPVVFYGFYPSAKRWSAVAARVVSIGAGFVVGLFATLAAHLAILSRELGGFSAARTAFGETFGKRVGGNASSLPAMYKESVEAKVLPVIWTYLDDKDVFFGVTAVGLILLCVLAAIVVSAKAREGEIPPERLPSYRALGAALIAGVFAPLSWYVLAKPHSYIHTHLNFVVWYLPFALFAAIAVGVLIDESLKSIVGRRLALPVLVGALGMIVVGFVWKQDAEYRANRVECDSGMKFCLRYDSFDVFSEGDVQLGAERFRIADNYVRAPFWRGHGVTVVHSWPAGATPPFPVQRYNSSGQLLR